MKTKDSFAITGYSYRLPGGLRTDKQFWKLLQKREFIQEHISTRYGRGYSPISELASANRFSSPYEGLIRDDEECMFDRGLFGLSHYEVRNMQPQMRMLLNCAWEAIEHSGWDILKLRNSPTGVFIGSQVPAAANWRALRGLNEHSIISASLAMLANQVSYHFNLMGPSATYCTACSAALTALHSALTAMNFGDCEQALIGSVTHLGSGRQSCGFGQLGVLSPEGKCNSFDASANGYMRSEGCFVFVVKRLDAAELDGDKIFAVIEATATNTAGAIEHSEGMLPGRFITTPTRHSQVSVMKSAAVRANREAYEFDYIEAHATGTAVGDRIEGNAIAEAFGNCGRKEPLRISSVKSNLGHLEAAAFHASLLKVILMFERRTFAPISKNYFEPNPEIDFDSCPMIVQTHCETFPDRQIVIGINSFGFGGSNGHCVISEYRPVKKHMWSIPIAPNSGYMIPLSARSPTALLKGAQNLREHLERDPTDLYTLVSNLARRRTHFATRTSFTAFNHQELLQQLVEFENQFDPSSTFGQEVFDQRIAMVFSGQGTQWAGCGQRLYDSNMVFRRVIDKIDEHWFEHADFSLREACFNDSQEHLNEVRLAQPVIFALQCALFELFKSWGVYPQVVVGHSSGEVAAAYACGALTLADATQLIYHRARLQQLVAGSGRMLAIGLDAASVEQLLDELEISFRKDGESVPQVEFACFNSPANVVICGKESVLQPLIDTLDQLNVQNSLLAGNIAFHSSAMDKIQDDVHVNLSFLNQCEFVPDVPFVSSVSGSVTQRLDCAYWWSNIRQPVNFTAAIETIKFDFPVDIFLEISPHRALQGMVVQCTGELNPQPASISSLLRDTDERIRFNETLGALFRLGVNIDFESQYPRPKPISHQLPGHHKEMQLIVDRTMDDELFLHQGHYSHGPLVGHKIHCDHDLFEASLSVKHMPYLDHHRVQLIPILPAAGYLELILEALEGHPIWCEEIEFLQACPIPKTAIRLQTALRPQPGLDTQFTVSISSLPYPTELNSKIESELNCRGRVQLLSKNHQIDPDVPDHLSKVVTDGFETIFENSETGESEYYERMEATLGSKYEYGPYFRTLKQLKVQSETQDFLIDVEMDEQLWKTGNAEGYVLCPPLIDGALQIFIYKLMNSTDLVAFPRRVRNMVFLDKPTSPRITVHAVNTRALEDARGMEHLGQIVLPIGEYSGGDLRFYDRDTGKLFMRIEQYICFLSNPNWLNIKNSKHVIEWQPKFMEPIISGEDGFCFSSIDPETLITNLAYSQESKPRMLRILELAGDRSPHQTFLNQCADSLSAKAMQIDYWLVNNSHDQTQACFDAFHNHKFPLRFVTYDKESLIDSELDAGLLRKCSVEILLLHQDEDEFKCEDWALFERLTVPSGLALIAHEKDHQVFPVAGWNTIRIESNLTLLQSQKTLNEVDLIEKPYSSRLIIGERNDVLSKWCFLIEKEGSSVDFAVSSDEAIERIDKIFETSAGVNEIDFFPLSSCLYDLTGEHVCAQLVELIQKLIHCLSEGSADKCRINVVTQNSVINVLNPAGASVWGMVRGLTAEIGDDCEIDIRLVDIHELNDLETLKWLSHNDVRERELAIRDGQLWVPRLIHIRDWSPLVQNTNDVSYHLTSEYHGQFNNLQMITRELPELGDHDVEIAVQYAALNFRDVMVGLGKLPPLAYERSMLGTEIGMEASGVIEKVGSKVENHKVGDLVLFTQGGCIANRAVVNEFQVFSKPDQLSMDEAASVMSVYVTAYYALVQLARLERNQKILIHSAMGGVGQAAVELAKRVGAQIYATAGNDSKQKQLLNLGALAVFDSHSFDWYSELMEETDGEGVDVVLNSLAGQHVLLCLQALKPGGWHCEIGKVDIYADNSLSLKVFRKNLHFAAIDMDRLMCDDPMLTRKMSEACLNMLATQEVKPVPTTIFEYHDYVKALRLMTSGQHQGKLVLRAPPPDSTDKGFPIVDARNHFDPNATYLITGGFGGFGLELIPYLVVFGARHFTLMDRNPDRGRTAEWIKHQSGLAHLDIEIEIDILPGDVSKLEDVKDCIAKLRRPLKGVFHLAGILDDRLLTDMTRESIAKVFSPKAQGAYNLHDATHDCELDHFVLFSSVASVFGNLGQSNYCAASAYLDGLAAYRKQIGLPALSYNMAGVAETGMVAQDFHVMRMIKASGLPPVSVSYAIRNLNYALHTMSDYDHVITAVFERPPWTVDSLEYMRSGHCISNRDSFETGHSNQLTLESVMALIAGKVSELCEHDEGDIEVPLSSFGLTSISVSELGAFILTQFHYRVSAVDLMTTSTIRSIAKAIMSADQNTDEDELNQDSSESPSKTPLLQYFRPKPSEFATRYEEHFPTSTNEGVRYQAAMGTE